jgi:Protein of unknown function (DUF3375)
LDSLDREALLRDTVAAIRASDTPLSLNNLAQRLPPTHDLETLALWLGMAREAACVIGTDRETLDVELRSVVPRDHAAQGATRQDVRTLRFQVPLLALDAEAFADFEWEP